MLPAGRCAQPFQDDRTRRGLPLGNVWPASSMQERKMPGVGESVVFHACSNKERISLLRGNHTA